MAPAAANLVGRSAQLAALDDALDTVAGRRAAIAALAGEPDMGKTRLLAELAARADARGLLVRSGSASELEAGLPFGVFVDALDEYLEGLEPRRLAGSTTSTGPTRGRSSCSARRCAACPRRPCCSRWRSGRTRRRTGSWRRWNGARGSRSAR
ncbi:AAA family ATPase [Solirubrobacter soli]|uniref:AAA family ATPase n=1 Tax=Solirubrobacter soli TaxID=363832 RepID=UPI0003FCF018|nr:AAA family ATPase [Solirubrobacter soli]